MKRLTWWMVAVFWLSVVVFVGAGVLGFTVVSATAAGLCMALFVIAALAGGFTS